jgi:pyruvate/2-oxoglutarate dehydrogenase complex dihydrolipoamide dehydrogenase (E3) component
MHQRAKETDGLSVGLSCKSGVPREHGTHLLLAVGRVPNTDDLGLEAAQIAIDKRGYIEVDEALRTTNPQVWGARRLQRQGRLHPHRLQRL